MSSLNEQLAHLHLLNRRERLALFIGAGVSFGCGLPDWSALIEKMINLAFAGAKPEVFESLRQLPLLGQTRILRNRLRGRFNERVAEALYSNSYVLSPAVEGIAKSGIQRICNYNFDDLIEEAFQVEGVEFQSIVPGDKFNGNFRGTLVLHPHGMLRQESTDREANLVEIVFSEEDYHRLYSDPYSWSNLRQLSLLMNNTCLFLGVSMTDPNLRRLLDVCISLGATHKHYATFRSPAYAKAHWEKPLARQLKAAKVADLESLNVEPIWLREYSEISEIMKRIRVRRSTRDQKAARPTDRGRTAPRRRTSAE